MGKRLNIGVFHTIAEERGGQCLSENYNNVYGKLRFCCGNDHEWETSAFSVYINGSWCPYCYGNVRLSIDDFKEIAKEKGGECLSDVYVNQRTRLKFRCKEGHVWTAIAASIRNCGSWCPQCSPWSKRYSIETCKEIAESNGGICLSKEYKHIFLKLLFRCGNGHIFELTLNELKNKNRWCPICKNKRNRGEEITRKIFEYLFDKPFPKARPKWLLGPKNGRMELDGFCEELNLAFEYQGEQHFRTVTFIPKEGPERLEIIQCRDEQKRKLCRDNGIICVDVMQFTNLTKRNAVDNILEALNVHNVEVNRDKCLDVDFRSIMTEVFSDSEEASNV